MSENFDPESTEIGGSRITLRPGRWRFFNFNELTVKLIEGDENHLDMKVEVVRGNNVTVGNGCEIDLVEYTGELREPKPLHIGRRRLV